MKFEPEDVLLKLDKSKLHIVVALAMLPQLALREGRFAGKNALSSVDIGVLTGISDRTIRKQLPTLRDWGLVVNVHARGWRLAVNDSLQLPLPLLWQGHSGIVLDEIVSAEISLSETEKISASAVDNSKVMRVDKHPQDTEQETTSASENLKRKKFPLQPHTRVIDQIDDDDEVIDPYGDCAFTESLMLMHHIGVNEEFADRFGRYPIEEMLAAWWHVKLWGKNPPALFQTHCTKKLNSTPRKFKELARWWVSAEPDERDEAIEAVRFKSRYPPAWPGRVIKAATAIYNDSEDKFDWPL